MPNPGGKAVRLIDQVLERARAAQERLNAIRSTERAEYELRDTAIVEAYELGAGTRKIATAVGISPTTVAGIISAN